MQYKMSPTEYFRKLVELYVESRNAKYYNPNIHRGRSASISSEFEDLTALFIALNNPKQCQYFVDQPLRFEGSSTKYPDVVIQEEDSEIRHLVDVKTDIGWNRSGMYTFCVEWERRVEAIKGTTTQFKVARTKEARNGKFSKELKYHVLIASRENASSQIDLDRTTVLNDLHNVRLYILSSGLHPNNYKFTQEETLSRIQIHEEEFERFFNQIIYD